MKIVLKESQINKVHDKFIDRLVDKTKIFEPEVLGDGWKYKYKVMVQFPFNNEPNEQHFNNYDDYSLSLPFISRFVDELKWLGSDLSFRDSISRQLYDKFIDKFSDKFVNFIRNYESHNDKIG
jgi:hypothetical protein